MRSFPLFFAVVLGLSLPAQASLSDYYLREKVKENSAVLEKMTEVIYKLAEKVNRLEEEQKRLKKALEERTPSQGIKPKKEPTSEGKPFSRFRKVLRIVSVFKQNNLDRIVKGLKLIQEETGAPLFAGIGRTYFVVFTTKPIDKEILKEAGFSDAYWEKTTKSIYEVVKPIHSADDVYSLCRELGR